MKHEIAEVDGERHAVAIHRINNLFPEQFEPLTPRHLKKGYWWLAYGGEDVIAFAGMIPLFPRIGYFKRCAVLEGHRGYDLQQRLMAVRELKAKSHTDWTHLVSDTSYMNVASANNFIRAGFALFEPDRPWEENSLFWIKSIA